MDSFATEIEALEHRLMRAWMGGDRKAMKALASRHFIFLFGSARATILDRPSWLDAAGDRFVLEGYRFGEIYVRRHGAIALFSCRAEIEARLGTAEWTGPVWLADLWQRTPVRRRWKLVERVATRPDADRDLPAAIGRLQLWR